MIEIYTYFLDVLEWLSTDKDYALALSEKEPDNTKAKNEYERITAAHYVGQKLFRDQRMEYVDDICKRLENAGITPSEYINFKEGGEMTKEQYKKIAEFHDKN